MVDGLSAWGASGSKARLRHGAKSGVNNNNEDGNIRWKLLIKNYQRFLRIHIIEFPIIREAMHGVMISNYLSCGKIYLI
jgi:hypothetical protein